MKVNPKITKYIEENILTKYSKNNYGGHGKDHILEVIKRFEGLQTKKTHQNKKKKKK